MHVIYIYILVFLNIILSIHIGVRHCGKNTISVIVDYTIKSRELNPTTVIYVVDVELIDGGET